MGVKRVEYHEGAVTDVKSAIAWYQDRSPKVALEFIDELRRAAETIQQGPERWPVGKRGTRRFLLWRFPFSIIYSEQEQRSRSGLLLTAVGDRDIGNSASRKNEPVMK